ncbi:hypothetical protein E2C01_066393 [Portunus trituberculatus]|uniref:Uncharacterized protein n=1 Tax=Portunus trituberculatus TaxID=210409 RepID=A0A5B7HI31_PORTR|nr:hypothetical protein [Portunus trituberculatus]
MKKKKDDDVYTSRFIRPNNLLSEKLAMAGRGLFLCLSVLELDGSQEAVVTRASGVECFSTK